MRVLNQASQDHLSCSPQRQVDLVKVKPDQNAQPENHLLGIRIHLKQILLSGAVVEP